MPDEVKAVVVEAKVPKFTAVPSHNVKTSADEDGNVLLTGSLFLNPHVVAALVGTKAVNVETKAIGEELLFTVKLGVTKSIHDVKPLPAPAPNTVAVKPTAKEAEATQVKPNDVVHPQPAPVPPVPGTSKPGTQAPIPATPEKNKTA